ncbi:hypothetical protein GOL40_31350 [Sinorhizobium medicae]|nr:hypothetical protein [Sinorhizobium medicae]
MENTIPLSISLAFLAAIFATLEQHCIFDSSPADTHANRTAFLVQRPNGHVLHSSSLVADEDGTRIGDTKLSEVHFQNVAMQHSVKPARRRFNDMAAKLGHDVPVIRQPTPMSCWATVYAMLVSWKEQRVVPIKTAIEKLGEPYTSYFLQDMGLPGGQELAFVEAAGLRALPPANYPLSTFRRLLREKGPVWVITGDGISSHARLLVGIYGPDEQEKRSSYIGTTLEFIDPRLGDYVYFSALDFFEEFEREAAFIVNSDLQWDLRWQVLSF